MDTKDARRIVAEGLERRKAIMYEREAQLERYEQEQIRACNQHCAGAKMRRQMDDTARLSREQQEARAAARREARAAEASRELAANRAVRYYALACMVILLVSAWTKLPLWAAATLAFGLAVFPAIYIFRLYVPLEDK